MTDNDEIQQRNRSPQYPYLSLDQAVNLIDVFYKKYRLNKVPISIGLKEIGYTHTSGAGKRVTASLTHYGLIDVEGSGESRRLSLSSLGKTIVMPNPSNPDERVNALRHAALRPEMHQWIYNYYRLDVNPLPPDDQLTYDLVNVVGFIDSSVPNFIKEFKTTYSYARLDSSEQLVDQSENLEEEIPKPTANVATQHTIRETTITLPADARELTTSLTRGKIARLVIPAEMNSMDFTLLVKWLELLREAALYEEQGGDS